MTQQQLVDAVAAAIADNIYPQPDDDSAEYAARAAIKLIVARCAQIALDFDRAEATQAMKDDARPLIVGASMAMDHQARMIATAIRKLNSEWVADD